MTKLSPGDKAQIEPEERNLVEAVEAAAGDGRCPGPTTLDIVARDGWPIPDVLTGDSYSFLGESDIPYRRYTDADFFDREIENVWGKVWQWACREEHIPAAGDYYVYDVGSRSVLIVRGEDQKVRAFHNVCAHRATRLRPSETTGSGDSFRCPFHGWTYNLQGELIDLPCRWDFPHVEKGRRLEPVNSGCWGGFVFINFDRDAPPLHEYLGVLPEHLQGRWDPASRCIALHIQKELPTNWKAAQEAFLEAYHVFETHPEFLATTSDANAKYDLFGPHVSRFYHVQGHPSPHYTDEQTQQEILDRMLVVPKGTVVPDGSSARSIAAEALRKELGEKWAIDLRAYSDTEMLDAIEYFLFPNMCIFPGITLPMVYRFRPLGNDRSKTLFDLILLRPLSPGEIAPEPPEPVRIGIEESYSEADGLLPILAHIYDQDTGNLENQWRGFLGSPDGGQTLGNYQEIRIRHMHATLDFYLSQGTKPQ